MQLQPLMRFEALSTLTREKDSCGCGGQAPRLAFGTADDLRNIRALTFGEPSGQACHCGHFCPRKYLAWTGFALGGFLALHFAFNLFGLWLGCFQSLVNLNHSLGMALPALEIGLIFVPLTIHIACGLRSLRRDTLKYGIKKPHHGSDARHWLQRASAIPLLAFIVFHVATMHRWFGGRFDSSHAVNSTSQSIWQFWSALPEGHPVNLLVAQFYLLGIVCAVYHMANGFATGAAVLGFVETRPAQERLYHVCLALAPALLLAGMAAWFALAQIHAF